MSFRNGSGLKAAVTILEARKNVGIGNAAPSKPPPDNSQVIRVTLTGADIRRALMRNRDHSACGPLDAALDRILAAERGP